MQEVEQTQSKDNRIRYCDFPKVAGPFFGPKKKMSRQVLCFFTTQSPQIDNFSRWQSRTSKKNTGILAEQDFTYFQRLESWTFFLKMATNGLL